MRVSYLKVICARPWGHIEDFWDLRSQKTKSQRPSKDKLFQKTDPQETSTSKGLVSCSGNDLISNSGIILFSQKNRNTITILLLLLYSIIAAKAKGGLIINM